MFSGGLKYLTSTLTMKTTSYIVTTAEVSFSPSMEISHDSSGSEKLDLAPESWHNKIPDYGDKFDNCDHTLDNFLKNGTA